MRPNQLVLMEVACGILIIFCASQVHCGSNEYKELNRHQNYLRDKVKTRAYDLECKLKECRRKVSTLTDHMVCLTNEKGAVQARVLTLQGKVAQLECNLADLRVQCDLKVQNLTDDYLCLKDQRNLQEDITKQLETDIENLNKDISNCFISLRMLSIAFTQTNNSITNAVGICVGQTLGVPLSYTETGVYHFRQVDNINQELSWFGAYDYCSAHGMKLLQLNDDQENLALSNKMTELGLSLTEKFWTSSQDIYVQGKFVNAGWGVGAIYLPWADGEPNDAAGERCVAIVNAPGGAKSYMQICSNKLLGLVCEMPEPCANLLLNVATLEP